MKRITLNEPVLFTLLKLFNLSVGVTHCTVATLRWEVKIWPQELLYAASDSEDKGQTCLISGWKV